ncbi:MAG: hypothetical protein ABJM06_11290 [Gilvibacter sp.]
MMNWLVRHKNKLLLLLGSFIGMYVTINVTVNLIGVPLAAYHSYKAWNDSQTLTVDQMLEQQESTVPKDSVRTDSLNLRKK